MFEFRTEILEGEETIKLKIGTSQLMKSFRWDSPIYCWETFFKGMEHRFKLGWRSSFPSFQLLFDYLEIFNVFRVLGRKGFLASLQSDKIIY